VWRGVVGGEKRFNRNRTGTKNSDSGGRGAEVCQKLVKEHVGAGWETVKYVDVLRKVPYRVADEPVTITNNA